jgi:trimeric autotransporter adhesin
MPSSRGCAGAVALLLTIAGCNHADAPAPGPDTLVVAPDTTALAVGESARVTATFQKDGAEFAAGAVTWASSDPSRAAVEGHDNMAAITAIAVGTATITASGSGLTATVTVAISPATLTALAIAPASLAVAAGLTRPVNVIATYSDSTTADVAPQVVWDVADSRIATASGAVLKGFAKGETLITARYVSQTASARVVVTDPVLQSINVTPSSVSVLVGTTQQFAATGSFSDGGSRDITATVDWASSATEVATISRSEGLATTLAVGQTTISATSGRVTGMATLTVDPSQ